MNYDVGIKIKSGDQFDEVKYRNIEEFHLK